MLHDIATINGLIYQQMVLNIYRKLREHKGKVRPVTSRYDLT
jgi:hypothetical protein